MRGSERHGNCEGQYVCIASVNMEIIYEKNVYVLFKERGHEKVKNPLRSFKFHRKKVSRGTRLCKCLLQKVNLLVEAASIRVSADVFAFFKKVGHIPTLI